MEPRASYASMAAKPARPPKGKPSFIRFLFVTEDIQDNEAKLRQDPNFNS